MLIVCCLRWPANSKGDTRNDGSTVQELHFEQDGDQHTSLYLAVRLPWEAYAPYLTGPEKPRRESDDTALGMQVVSHFSCTCQRSAHDDTKLPQLARNGP